MFASNDVFHYILFYDLDNFFDNYDINNLCD